MLNEYYLAKNKKYQPKSTNFLYPMVWDKAENATITDADKNTYIDFTSGIFVANAGHGNQDTIQAIKEAVDKPLLHSFLYPNQYSADLAELLVNITPDNITKALLLSGGGESVENAIKMMKIYGIKQNPKKNIVIGIKGMFHGESMSCRMLCAEDEWFKGSDARIYAMEYTSDFYNDLFKLSSKYNFEFNEIAGFVISPYFGWSAEFLNTLYVQLIADFCKNYHALLCSDEIQAGFGRTGKLFGFEHFGIKPDIITLGKGVSGGLPLSVVLANDEIFGDDLSLNSTHTNNPVVCSSAISNILYILNNQLIEKTALNEKEVREKLQVIAEKYNLYLNGKGACFALIFKDTEIVQKIINKAFENGLLLINTMKNSIKIGFPLTISDEELKKGLAILDKCIGEVINS